MAERSGDVHAARPFAGGAAGATHPDGPVDLVAALGKADQKLYISRDLGLVVARLGDKADPGTRPALSTFDAALWAILVHLRTGVD